MFLVLHTTNKAQTVVLQVKLLVPSQPAMKFDNFELSRLQMFSIEGAIRNGISFVRSKMELITTATSQHKTHGSSSRHKSPPFVSIHTVIRLTVPSTGRYPCPMTLS